MELLAMACGVWFCIIIRGICRFIITQNPKTFTDDLIPTSKKWYDDDNREGDRL